VNASDDTYGYRRIHAALRRQGEDCGPELVRDLMRDLGLVACQPRPWRPITTQPGGASQTIPDLVGRDFTAAAPGTKLVGDITYLPTWQGFCYLATVIDCCTKECIGYAIADHMRAELVIDALRMAARNYLLAPEAIFHSDRGAQYRSEAFADAVARLDIRQSVGRVGSCFDNALAESFNATLKVERVNPDCLSDEGTRLYGCGSIHRVPLQYQATSLGAGLPYPTGGLQRVPESAASGLTTRIVAIRKTRGGPEVDCRSSFWKWCCTDDGGYGPSESPCGGRLQTASCCVG
jgi:putative transposase